MNIVAFVCFLFAAVAFLVEFRGHYYSRSNRYYWLAIGLFFTVSMIASQLLHDTKPIHF